MIPIAKSEVSYLGNRTMAPFPRVRGLARSTQARAYSLLYSQLIGGYREGIENQYILIRDS